MNGGKWTLVVTVAAMFILSNPQAEPSDGSREKARPVVKVGVIVPLSGNNAFVGEDILDGFTLARETIFSDYDFQFIYEDSRLELRQAATAAQKLINVDKVDIVVSLWDTTDVVAPIAQKAGLLHFGLRWDPRITQDFPHLFTLECTYQTYVDWHTRLWEKLGTKRVAIIRDKTKGWALCSEYLHARQLPNGMKVVFEEAHNSEQRDFRGIFIKARQEHPDLYVLWNYPPAIEVAARQLREMDPGAAMTGDFETVQNKKLVEGCWYINTLSMTPEFAQLFEKRFGRPVKIRAPHAYDLFGILAKAYKQAGENSRPDSQQLVAALMAIRDFPGALGPLTMEPGRNIRSLPVVMRVQGGQAVAVEMDKIGPVVNYY
jgi:ABC-type branched-subunit amino acid transport system substrate-binding protein